MARILIDAREYTTSTGRYMFRLLQYLEKLESGHDFTILLKPGDMEAYTFTNPRFRKVATPYKEFTFAEQGGLLRQLQGLKPDLVHFGMTQQPILYNGLSVTTVHDLTVAKMINTYKMRTLYRLKQQVYRYVVKKVARKSAAIITPSEFTKQGLVQYAHIDPQKVTVTYEAADLISEAPAPLPDLQNKQFIMYLGRPTPHKNLPRLIEAFQLLQKQYPALVLVLAGKKDENYRFVEADVQAKGIQNVYFTDFVSEGALRWLYENCAAYVFPSLSEGFGLPGLEAMAHGAPVVSSRETCLPEVYGDAAHYFNPYDVNAIALGISQVLDDPALRQKLIAAGHAQVAKYSWQRLAEQTLAVYDRLLGS